MSNADLRIALVTLLAYVERTTDPDATLIPSRDERRRNDAIALARAALGIPGESGGIRSTPPPRYPSKG